MRMGAEQVENRWHQSSFDNKGPDKDHFQNNCSFAKNFRKCTPSLISSDDAICTNGALSNRSKTYQVCQTWLNTSWKPATVQGHVYAQGEVGEPS